MTEEEKKILERFGEMLPKLSDFDKGYILGLGDSMDIHGEKKEETEEKPKREMQLA